MIDKEAFRRVAEEKPVFTVEQGGVALDKHGLGPVVEWIDLGANVTNCMYKAISHETSYFVKIKFRKAFSLKVQCHVTALLHETTDLPVSEICIFDEDTDVFGYPYLISNELPGVNGMSYFEAASDQQRCCLLRAFGSVVAIINRQVVSDDSLPRRGDLTHWREDLQDKIQDEDLIKVLPAACQVKLLVIANLLDKIDVVPEPSSHGLLWGDVALHNILVDDEERITGVHDFENGAVGDLLEDQLHIAGDFRTRKPREIYGQTHYQEEFWSGYEEAGGVRIEPDETYLKVRQATTGAGFYWFWKVLGVLHPKTSIWLEDLEAGLRRLVEIDA